jgi:ketosteroid isomerase-like protein
MTDADFIKFAEDMDRCWQESRFHDLATFLADDVVIVAPDGKTRLEGIAAVVESYREFTVSSLVEHYITSGYIVTHRGGAAVIEYRWEMAWTSAGADYDDTGREVLVLASREGEWRVIWRTQIPATR